MWCVRRVSEGGVRESYVALSEHKKTPQIAADHGLQPTNGDRSGRKKSPGRSPGVNPQLGRTYCIATRVTRRFWARPSLVELSAIGLYSP